MKGEGPHSIAEVRGGGNKKRQGAAADRGEMGIGCGGALSTENSDIRRGNSFCSGKNGSATMNRKKKILHDPCIRSWKKLA